MTGILPVVYTEQCPPRALFGEWALDTAYTTVHSLRTSETDCDCYGHTGMRTESAKNNDRFRGEANVSKKEAVEIDSRYFGRCQFE